MKVNRNIKLFIIITIIILSTITVGILYIVKDNLIKNHQVAEAVIINCDWKSKGTARYVVEGIFKINNVSYKASCQLKCQDLNLIQLRNRLINLQVKAVYNPKHPSINYLLIEKSAYDLYDVSVPRSLLWLDEFVRCH